ncbi:MAG: methionyl-tRNA formyltransferase [candidate division WOR-3 bacterium]
MSYIFFGSGDFAARLLGVLAESNIMPDLVVSTPDKPRGRGLMITPGPVPQASRRLGLTLVQPERVNSPDFVSGLPRTDFILVSDFGRILKKPLLELPRIAPLNLHPSLLPRWRGAAPIERSIMAGGPYGLTVFVMDEGTDTGPIVLQEEISKTKEVALPDYPTKEDIVTAYLAIAPELVRSAFEGLASGSLKPVPQEGEPSYAPKIEKSELWPLWNMSPEEVARHINALSPKPGARMTFRGRLIKLLRAFPARGLAGQPGEVILGERYLMVACSGGVVCIETLQPEGGRPMLSADFMRGLR